MTRLTVDSSCTGRAACKRRGSTVVQLSTEVRASAVSSPSSPMDFKQIKLPSPSFGSPSTTLKATLRAFNHVIKKYPDAPSYHRFVVSVEMSHYILNHLLTRSWTSYRANEFRKYTEPVHIDDLQETRCFERHTRNGIKAAVYFSMTRH